MRVDYTARANAHYRWAERYNRNGKEAKALAHFGRALEYDKRANSNRADPAFGLRDYGEDKLHPKYVENANSPRRLDDLMVETVTLPGVGLGGTDVDFAIPVAGSGMFVTHDDLKNVYKLDYRTLTQRIRTRDLLKDEKDTHFEIMQTLLREDTIIHRQAGLSILGGAPDRPCVYIHYSWIPNPRTEPNEAIHFIYRVKVGVQPP